MALSATDLQAKARTLTGISLEDTGVHEALTVLVASLNHDARLSPAGEAAMEQRLVHLLANRLRMERDFLAHPEIAEEKVVAPVFVFGIPRSGTTKLQKILSATDDFNVMPFWMAFNPSLLTGNRSESVTPRITDTERHVKWMDQIAPGVRIVHPFDVYEPEEVNPILEQAFHNYYWPAFVDVPGYIAWESSQDPHLQLRYLHRTLQYLQWQFAFDHEKPWVLKNPTFVGMEPVIKDVFPDAHLVMTHRHPSVCVASSVSLQAAFHKMYNDLDINAPDIELSASAGYMLLEGLGMAMKQNALNRTAFANLGIMDCSYSGLTKDSAAVVEEIYRHIGKPFSSQARANIMEWEQQHQQHKYGAHHYQLADFRLTEDMVAQRFVDYLRDYRQYF